jgi:hypothetical protein
MKFPIPVMSSRNPLAIAAATAPAELGFTTAMTSQRNTRVIRIGLILAPVWARFQVTPMMMKIPTATITNMPVSSV